MEGGMLEGYTVTELVAEVDAELLLTAACNTSIRGTCGGSAEGG